MSMVNEDIVAEFAGMRRAVTDAVHEGRAPDSVSRTIAQLERYLARPSRAVVLGEPNAGKTSLVNAIVGCEALPTAVVENTPVAVTVRHGAAFQLRVQSDSGAWRVIDRERAFDVIEAMADSNLRAVELRVPKPVLKTIEFVDTPGGAEPEEHIAGADIAIWCTNANQAWSESERSVWEGLPRRCRRNGILAITHTDAIFSIEDRRKVLARLHDEAGHLFEDFVFVCNCPGGEGVDVVLNCIESLVSANRERRGKAVRKIASRLNGGFIVETERRLAS